eukprot:TRINITY_DN24339_c0_g1_i1.p1 TRINITY_DN24339_c0_g1~~TRINITY_DN24339_c0_g1_i1.p1  ORF type:complete len:171 (+),score=15.77 TRINITY_DN24339_c0_g1_i1:735-1247(+)
MKLKTEKVVASVRPSQSDQVFVQTWHSGGRRWLTSRSSLQSEQKVNVVVVSANETSCKQVWYQGRDHYCRFYSTLQLVWARLQPSGTESAGMLWVEFPHVADFSHGLASYDGSRHDSLCRKKAVAQDHDIICPAFAVVDFFEALRPWDAAYYKWNHRGKDGVMLAIKLPP